MALTNLSAQARRAESEVAEIGSCMLRLRQELLELRARQTGAVPAELLALLPMLYGLELAERQQAQVYIAKHASYQSLLQSSSLLAQQQQALQRVEDRLTAQQRAARAHAHTVRDLLELNDSISNNLRTE